MENLDTINPEDIAYNYIAEMFLEPVSVKYYEQVVPNVCLVKGSRRGHLSFKKC